VHPIFPSFIREAQQVDSCSDLPNTYCTFLVNKLHLSDGGLGILMTLCAFSPCAMTANTTFYLALYSCRRLLCDPERLVYHTCCSLASRWIIRTRFVVGIPRFIYSSYVLARVRVFVSKPPQNMDVKRFLCNV
jgi:hypothetical protein